MFVLIPGTTYHQVAKDGGIFPPLMGPAGGLVPGLQYSLFDRLLNSPTLFNSEINMLQDSMGSPWRAPKK